MKLETVTAVNSQQKDFHVSFFHPCQESCNAIQQQFIAILSYKGLLFFKLA